MRGFAMRSTVEQALAWLDCQLRALPAESASLAEAGGRVLAEAVRSRFDVPGFDRAMMDGFALLGAETQGASTYHPQTFRIVGESLPGRPFAGTMQPGETVRIMTGAPMPAGADAVLPVEKAAATETTLAVYEDTPPCKHVGRRGEDIAAGAEALSAGRRLRPQDLGLLASVGAAKVSVVRRPKVRIVITGDELLPAGAEPAGVRIVDANGPMLAALVERDGGVAKNPGIVPDREDAILAALRDDADVVLVSGGSSVGQEDYAPRLLARHGQLAVHGLAMRPSSPAGMGLLDGKLVFLLPGNPVSCLCAYDFFAGRAIRVLGGRTSIWPYRKIEAPLVRKLNSVVGRLDYSRVRLIESGVEPMAIGGASILSSTTRADGFVVVPADSEGYPSGAIVTTWLYDEPGLRP